jgi:DNA primase
MQLFTEVNTQIFNEIVSKLKSGEKLTVNEMNIDKQLLGKIDKFAPIKHLLKNKSKNEYELIELLDDIRGDLKNYDLENRVKELELKFSKDPSEATFNELKNEKKKQNIN